MKTEKNIYIEPQTISVEGNNDTVLMAGSDQGQTTQDDDSRPAKSFQPIGDEDLIGSWEDESDNASSSPEKSRGW